MSVARGSEFVLRLSHSQDAEAIRDLLLESNLSAPTVAGPASATAASIGQIFTLVCEQRHELAGVLQWRDLGPEVEILDLAVRTSHRRQGVASRLLENFLLRVAASGARQIFLEVRESNIAATELYRKFGFRVGSRRANYYRNPAESALVMVLATNP